MFEPQHFGTVSHAMALIALAEAARPPDPLDRYIEAHVHGPVLLACDVEALVLDPCFRGTPLENLAYNMPCPIEWHAGLLLDVETLLQHPDCRGAEIAALGTQVTRNGVLTPAAIGEAVASGVHAPQALKRAWHCMAGCGGPSPSILH